MKSIFKLIPAVLAGIALVGCSSDDLYTNGEQPIEYTANDLEVNFTPFIEGGVTRAAWSNNQLSTFQAGDAIRVYDETLTTFDKYTFADGKFTKGDGTRIGTPKFALFPSKYVSYGEWKENGDVIAVIQVPSVIKYDATSEIAQGDEIAYVSEVPAFGTPTDKGTHLAVENLTALTAIYRVTLNGIKGNHNFLKIQAAKSNLSGKFDAVLTADKPQLVQSPDLVGKNYIIVDLQSVPSTRTVLYIPIIPGEYPAATNRFTVQVSDDSQTSIWTDDAKANPETVVTTDGAWKDLDPAVTNDKTFKVNEVRGLTRAFQLNVSTTEELSRLLKTDKNLTGDVAYQLKKLDINRNEDYTDYTIEVPNMKANSLTIGVTDLNNNLGSEQKLVIKHADAKDPYTKKVVLNVAGITGSSKTPVEIDLPECDVQIIGDYTNCSNITIKNAKSLTFGDGTTATPIKGTTTLKITDEDGKSTIAESLTIAENATVGQDIALGTDVKKTFKVNIGGDISKNILSVYRATTEVTGKGKVQTLRSMGDVTIEGTRSDFAVGNLYLNGTEQNVDLRSGIVLTIGTQSETANRTATVNNEETGATYIGSINGNDKITITLGTSKWAGKKLTGSYADKKDIYTASMLASITGSSAESYVLQNNIDLNGSAEGRNWTSVDLKSAFDGNKKTISNLKSTTGGLFNVAMAAEAEIKNLTIADPTIALAAKSVTGVGVLANTVETSKLTVTNVKATNIAITGKDATSKVGGLIGTNSSAVVLSGVSTTGNIAGYSMLGGLIGDAEADVTIQKAGDNKSTSTVSISANYNSGEDYDLNYASAGQFIGSMNKEAEIKMTDVTVGTTGFTHDTGEFKGKILYPVVTSGKVTGKEVKFGQDLIGYSGDEAISEKVTINGEDKKYPSFETKTAYTTEKGTSTSFTFLYYIDK